jgi:hypothetical protein
MVGEVVAILEAGPERIEEPRQRARACRCKTRVVGRVPGASHLESDTPLLST